MRDWSQVQWFFFDLDGTLWDHDSAAYRAIAELSIQLDLQVEEFARNFKVANKQMWQDRVALNIPVQVMRVMRMEKALIATIGKHSHDVEELNLRYLDLYTSQFSVMEGAVDAVNLAADLGKVAIVTNGLPDTQEAKMAQLGAAADRVSFLHCAENIDHMKPRPEYYQSAAAKAGVNKSESLAMIGDSWEEDVLTPASLGWRTLWLDHGRTLPDQGICPHSISNITEFAKFLRGVGMIPQR